MACRAGGRNASPDCAAAVVVRSGTPRRAASARGRTVIGARGASGGLEREPDLEPPVRVDLLEGGDVGVDVLEHAPEPDPGADGEPPATTEQPVVVQHDA